MPKKKESNPKSVKKTSTPSAKPVQASKPKSAVSGEWDKFRAILLQARGRIAGDLQHLEDDSLKINQRDASGDLSGYSFHMADMASDNFEREFTLGLASSEQQSLNAIDQALRKIDDGGYGICEECSKPIPLKRLAAMPYARLCIKCQEVEEKQQRRR